MSPEVLSGATVTEKVDVYAFGIVLWEMITGQEPFGHHRDYPTFVRAIVGGVCKKASIWAWSFLARINLF